MSWKKDAKKVYNFIFHDDSILSWIVNIFLAFLIVKFLVYPGLGFALSTDYPMVAVISGSMEHEGMSFDTWWADNGPWYEQNGISKAEFEQFSMKNGFNKGDVIVLKGRESYEVGDILVYQSSFHPYPIIHRATYINEDENTFVLKGDNNADMDPSEVSIEQVEGEALLRVPWIGWVKLIFVEIIGG